MTITRSTYIRACLSAPFVDDHEKEVALAARIIQEWGSDSGHGPQDDALDLTQPEPGEWAFNSFDGGALHVWNYPSLALGVKGFHDILTGSQYRQVVALLCSRTSTAEQIIGAWNATNWGYCNPAFIAQVRAHFDFYMGLQIPDAPPKVIVKPKPALPKLVPPGNVVKATTGVGWWFVRAGKKAGIPNPPALSALELRGAVPKILTPAQLKSLPTVAFGHN